MQIQRIQTLWLILALGCLIAFIVLPFGSWDDPALGVTASLMPYEFAGLIIPAAVACILLVIDIFAYKNLSLQRSVAVMSLLMLLVSAGIAIYILCDRATQGAIHWGWEPAFLLGSLFFTLLAIRGINHDAKLLRSYDRLR